MNNTKLYGLVLCGGKSTRMGEDKGNLRYHQLPQQEHLFHLLDQLCDRTFYSLREEQRADFPEGANLIVDADKYRGPFNGMLSARKQHPEVAWLVVACDIPLINKEALTQLVEARDSSKYATAFATRQSGLPEPLAAIWEPKALLQSERYLDNGDSTCPRKFLINSDIKLVFPLDDEVLLNANSKEDYEQVLLKLGKV
ncbi:NTP transferase domain-containing protein [Poritiphilus flavus]|uniref:Probable molybdenum cofactor guanylyltransferase n=1 Tax=Poritiphilus flavus TaxID=2697053 RepID=A0A6L9EG29_9FLAO|nr:NTP transferase domain-containing protein [Poritiphilus flavus]NAS13219.1 NTP transferase domain-containing protein [Poritiphilus flavus]